MYGEPTAMDHNITWESQTQQLFSLERLTRTKALLGNGWRKWLHGDVGGGLIFGEYDSRCCLTEQMGGGWLNLYDDVVVVQLYQVGATFFPVHSYRAMHGCFSSENRAQLASKCTLVLLVIGFEILFYARIYV